jgi:hypothetical protein
MPPQTVDEFIRTRVPPEHRDIVARLRALVREHAPGVQEIIFRGIPGFRGRGMIAVINPNRKDITFAFARGADLEDRYGLLRGVGRVSKHLKITSLERFNEDAFIYYLNQAVELDSR